MKLIRIIYVCCCCAAITASSHEGSQDPYIKWSNEKLEDNDFTRDLVQINVTRSSVRPKTKYADMGACPNFTAEYLSSTTETSQRSTSPWRYYINYDKYREPKMIVDTQCLCRGCIDMTTRVQDGTRTASVGIFRPIPVLRFNRSRYFYVQVGCTCVFPEIRPGK